MQDDVVAPQDRSVLSPSEFMRQRHPEVFSDSHERSLYRLEQDVLELRLETLTARNEMQPFEHFARALCQRFVCPFLKPATGPEGGGDGKVDTETIAVSEEIRERYYEGRANQGNDRWGFAFSTKQDWKSKARADVEGMVGTGRGYTTVFFVTSRYARSKDRSALQDELATQHDVIVEILDRNWIVERVIDKDARDLAHIHLGVGERVEEAKIGPRDRDRLERLEALDRELEMPDLDGTTLLGMVRMALDAAILSRELERPRFETEGRLERAIRLADRYGSDRHALRARYEKLWTLLNWFDDIAAVRDGYEDLEARAVALDHALALEKATNILLILSGPFAQATVGGAEVDVPSAWRRLEGHLEAMRDDERRPNNSLSARTGLLVRRIMTDLQAGERASIETRLQDLIGIIDAAEGLLEYDFDRLEQFVEVFGELFGSSDTLSRVIDRFGDALAARRGETARGLLFLRRAQQLDIERGRFEVIRRLGTVIESLTKEEHLEELVEAAYLLAVAYRGVGLLWAARSAALFALSCILIQAERETLPPSEILPTFQLLGWIDLELGLVAELVEALVVTRGVLASLPFDELARDRAQDVRETMDMALGGQFLNAREQNLSAFQVLPDLLQAIELPIASGGLLYALGYEDEVLGPEPKEREANRAVLGRLASQPACSLPRHGLLVSANEPFKLHTKLLGLELWVSGEGGARCHLVAHILISITETLLATGFEAGFIAHREAYEIRVDLSDAADAPRYGLDEEPGLACLEWPMDWDPMEPGKASSAGRTLFLMVAEIVNRTCIPRNCITSFQTLLDNDTAMTRMTTPLGLGVSLSRVFDGPVLDLDGLTARRATFEAREFPQRAVLPLPDVPLSSDEIAEEIHELEPGRIRTHRNLSVRSLIDIPTWDRAKWRGVAVMKLPTLELPVLALMFEMPEAGQRIFADWRDRLGEADNRNELRVVIVTDLPSRPASHYGVMFTTNVESQSGEDEILVVAARSLIMEPNVDTNLRLFLDAWDTAGAYLIGAASLPGPDGPPDLERSSVLLKRDLLVKKYRDLEEHESRLFGR